MTLAKITFPSSPILQAFKFHVSHATLAEPTSPPNLTKNGSAEPMNPDRFVTRRKKLAGKLRQTDAQALLVTNFTNVRYLTGFTGDDSFLLFQKDKPILISDSRYEDQISEECPDLDVFIRPSSETIISAVGKVVAAAKLRTLAVESTTTTVDQWRAIEDKVKPLELTAASGLVEELRMIKDADEISEIREAIRQAERGFAVLKASLVPEMTELQGAHLLEHAMRQFGALRASFDPIVAVGARAALPHGRPSDQTLSAAEFVLVDWGATNRRGYRSDLTRLLVTGKISPKLENLYRVVLTAQLAGIKAIRPGVTGREVDAAARDVIQQAGYGKKFGHALGHGIGLDIHEGPRLGASSTTELQPGMVVTVEPGIYLPGWGGIRIEDDVLVTRDGCEVLSSVPKDFEQTILG